MSHGCRMFVSSAVWVLNIIRLHPTAATACSTLLVRPSSRAAFIHSSSLWRTGQSASGSRSAVDHRNAGSKPTLAGFRPAGFMDAIQRAKKVKALLKAHAETSIEQSSQQPEPYAFVEEDGEEFEEEEVQQPLKTKAPGNKGISRESVAPTSGGGVKISEEEESEYKFEGPTRCGTVAIVGAPNAGKSTLMNYLVGSKVAIVTHKRQTTRNCVTGIGMEGGTQIVYLDTPGIMAPRPKERLNKAMVKSAWNSARDADEVFFMIDVDKIIPGGERFGRRAPPVQHPVSPEALRLRETSNEHLVLRRLCERRQPFNLILNKVDQLKGERRALLLPFAEELRRQAVVEETGACMVKKVFAVSAISGKGLDVLRAYLRDALPLGDWLYPPDQTSSAPLRSIVAEITRESILLRAHEEVPYVAFVETDRFEERPDGSVRIEQDIYVETEGQKKIIVGMIRDLGVRSRREMSRFLERPVHLFLTVRAKKGWTEESRGMYEKLGLDFNA